MGGNRKKSPNSEPVVRQYGRDQESQLDPTLWHNSAPKNTSKDSTQIKNTNIPIRRQRTNPRQDSNPRDLREVLNIIRTQRNGPARRQIIGDMLSVIANELQQTQEAEDLARREEELARRREEELARQREEELARRRMEILARCRERLRERIHRGELPYHRAERAVQVAYPNLTRRMANYLLMHLGYQPNPHYLGEDLRPYAEIGNGQFAERYITHWGHCRCGSNMEQVLGDVPMLDAICPRGCGSLEIKAVSAREGRTIIHLNPLAAGIILRYGVHLFSRMSYLTVVVLNNGFGYERRVVDIITLHPEFLERHIRARYAAGDTLHEASAINILDYLPQVPYWKTW